MTTTRLFCAAIAIALFAPVTFGQEPPANNDQSVDAEQIFASSDFQDSERRLPGDNVGWFSPESKSVTIQLSIPGESEGNADAPNELAGSVITVVDPNNKTHVLIADKDGRAVLENVVEGAHAVMASNNQQHGAILVALRHIQKPQNGIADIFGDDFEADDKMQPVRLSMLKVIPKDFLTIVKNNLPIDATKDLRKLDYGIVHTTASGESFESKIQLGKNGSLRGKLASVVQPRSRYSAVQSTNILILKNGKVVGKTTSNALGQFMITGVHPGVHGLIVAGRGGYAAFAFEAVERDGLVSRDSNGRMFAMSHLLNDGETLPVALIPPQMCPQTAGNIVATYREFNRIAEKKRRELERKLASEKIRKESMQQERMDAAQTFNQQALAVEQAKRNAQKARLAKEKLQHDKAVAAARNQILANADDRPSFDTFKPESVRSKTATNQIAKPDATRAKAPISWRPTNPLRGNQDSQSAPFNPLRGPSAN